MAYGAISATFILFRGPSAYQRGPRVLAKLRRRSGGVHVAEEVLDPPEGDAAARVTHLRRGRFLLFELGGSLTAKNKRGWIIVSAPLCAAFNAPLDPLGR